MESNGSGGGTPLHIPPGGSASGHFSFLVQWQQVVPPGGGIDLASWEGSSSAMRQDEGRKSPKRRRLGSSELHQRPTTSLVSVGDLLRLLVARLAAPVVSVRGIALLSVLSGFLAVLGQGVSMIATALTFSAAAPAVVQNQPGPPLEPPLF